MTLQAPFPYFGGKRHVAPLVWQLIGDADAYVEPFAGSAAVLLGRPAFEGKRREILNDLDGWITNLWRSIRDQPEEVVRHAAGPIMELDIRGRRPSFIDWLAGDPGNCDPQAAAWWLYATVSSIAGGTQRGPWIQRDGYMVKEAVGSRSGICRSVPHISRGRNVSEMTDLVALQKLQARLQSVVITCGDWTRPLSPALRSYRTVGVFLDPPYESHARTSDGQTLYMNDGLDVSASVRDWCRTAPDWRIVLSGYESEHDDLLEHGWRKANPPRHQSSGYNTTGLNAQRDRLWYSPACIAEDGGLFDLLDGGGAA